MGSSQSSSDVASFSSSTALNKLQTGIQSNYGPVRLSFQMEYDYALSLLCAIIVGHVSLNFVDSFYFEEWRKRKMQHQMMTGKNPWLKNCHHQLLPSYLQVIQEDFLNGCTSGLCTHVQLSHNSAHVSAYVAPFHPSLHCCNNTLHGGGVM